MKKNFYQLMVLCICLLGLMSCKDDAEIKLASLNVTYSTLKGVEGASISNLVCSFKNISTGQVTESKEVTKQNGVVVSLPEGLYNVSLEGDVTYSVDGTSIAGKVKAYKESVQVVGDKNSVSLELFLSNTKSDFVISEIFFAGSLTPEGKQYNGDNYIKICNNSNQTLYADGLAIVESGFLTVSKFDYEPNVMSTDMPVQAIYRIPGTGKEHPVKPGESLLICDNAIDHTKANTNSFDLTKADFEWYDVSTNPNFSDIDNPNVPNLEKIYCYTKTVWSLHNRGFRAYAIARLEKNKEVFLKENKYDYTYMMHFSSGDYKMSGSTYKIPNSWVVDAVNLSVKSVFQWIVTDPSLDMGWTNCGDIDGDVKRYGKSVIRKYSPAVNPDGRKVLMDTNNSTFDFQPQATPSLAQVAK